MIFYKGRYIIAGCSKQSLSKSRSGRFVNSTTNSAQSVFSKRARFNLCIVAKGTGPCVVAFSVRLPLAKLVLLCYGPVFLVLTAQRTDTGVGAIAVVFVLERFLV